MEDTLMTKKTDELAEIIRLATAIAHLARQMQQGQTDDDDDELLLQAGAKKFFSQEEPSAKVEWRNDEAAAGPSLSDYLLWRNEVVRAIDGAKSQPASAWIKIVATKEIGNPDRDGMFPGKTGNDYYRYRMASGFHFLAPPEGRESRKCLAHSLELIRDTALRKLTDYRDWLEPRIAALQAQARHPRTGRR